MTKTRLALLEPDADDETVDEFIAALRGGEKKRYDPDQPRAPKGDPDGGKWTAAGSGGGAIGTKDNPLVTDDVTEAAKALGEGKYVELKSKDEVATLLDRLQELAKEAKEKGEEARVYDLCKVTVPGTNVFCVESKGIRRVEMPQRKTHP